jgi:hypothetical protein
VRTGQYAQQPDQVAPWRAADTAAEAIRMLVTRIRSSDGPSAERRTQQM